MNTLSQPSAQIAVVQLLFFIALAGGLLLRVTFRTMHTLKAPFRALAIAVLAYLASMWLCAVVFTPSAGPYGSLVILALLGGNGAAGVLSGVAYLAEPRIRKT